MRIIPSVGLDPKARMQRRKERERKQREEELLEARRAYFEERKIAEAKRQGQYHRSDNPGQLPRSPPKQGPRSPAMAPTPTPGELPPAVRRCRLNTSG